VSANKGKSLNPQDNTMSEDIAATFGREGSPAFPTETGTENPASSPEDQTPSEQTLSPEENKTPEAPEGTPEGTEGEQAKNNENAGDAGLAKHPRWKEREDDWKGRFNDQESRHVEEMRKMNEKIEGLSNQKPPETKEPTGDIPSWFGGDESQWAEFQTWNDGLVKQGRDEALKEINSKSDKENKAVAEATQYFKDQVIELEGDGSKVDRNKLLKFTIDNDLVDSKGRWNYKAAHTMMQGNVRTTNTEKLDKKKQIAVATTSEKTSETKPSDIMTSKDFENPTNRQW